MFSKTSLLESILATPAVGSNRVTPAIRSSLLTSLFEHQRSLLMSGLASGFAAVVAFVRLHQVWPLLWLAATAAVIAGRLGIARAYVVASRSAKVHPLRPVTRYASLALATSALLGAASMACVMSADAAVCALAIMVTAGTLGGVASRSACVPRLAIAQIVLGAVPTGIGAALAPAHVYWVLAVPLFAYIPAMTSIVRRHYSGLVALMAAEQTNAELAARFDAALAHVPHGLCTTDESGSVIIANRRTAELFGATVEMLRLNVPLPEFIGHVGLAKFGETFRKQLVERCRAWLDESRHPLDLKLDDGRELEMTRNPVPDGSAVIIIEDVTERRRNEAKILDWARHDSLTGLPNRRRLREQFDRMLSENGGQHEGAAVMYVDLNHFKQVNDALGHHAGDEVLRAVAQRLKRTLRHGEIAARLGGDEFAIVVERATPAASASLAGRVIRQLSEPYTLSSGDVAKIGASIGIAFTRPDEPFLRITKRADRALYEAKAAGKGLFRFSTEGGGDGNPPAAETDRPTTEICK